MPTIPLDEIHVSRDRIRTAETVGDIEALADLLAEDGQYQDILIRPFDPERDSVEEDSESSPEWTLIDGGRRWLASRLLEKTQRTIRGLKPGVIGAKLREEDDDPIVQLRMEFYANEYREDFSWQEKRDFYLRAHKLLSERAESTESDWDYYDTAAFLKITYRTLMGYVELADPEIADSEEVSSASSFRTARKKAKILKDKKRRKRLVKAREESEKSKGQTYTDYLSHAADLCHHGDCREWLESIEDNHFDWFHWDPPYGGEQAGGAFSSLEQIDDTEDYAKALISETLPEIYRTLKTGSWLVVWFHQSHREWLLRVLQANGFWVNPYECIWYKRDRTSDGHEITRFLTNAYEPFFLCGIEPEEDNLILPNSSPQNVFVHDTVSKADRRHPMHKPAPLIKEILSIISIPGELGGDASAGGGSIVEAALNSGRKIEVCELSDTYHLTCVEVMADTLRERGVSVAHQKEPDLPDEIEL